MDQRFHRRFTATVKTELWDRWQRGESLKAIGRAFGQPSSSIYFQVDIGAFHDLIDFERLLAERAQDNDDANGEARPDGQRRCDVKLTLNDLLAGLAGTVRSALAERAHDVALLGRMSPLPHRC